MKYNRHHLIKMVISPAVLKELAFIIVTKKTEIIFLILQMLQVTFSPNLVLFLSKCYALIIYQTLNFMEIYLLINSNLARSKSLAVQIRRIVSQAMKLMNISKVNNFRFFMPTINRSINLTSMMLKKFRLTPKTAL